MCKFTRKNFSNIPSSYRTCGDSWSHKMPSIICDRHAALGMYKLQRLLPEAIRIEALARKSY